MVVGIWTIHWSDNLWLFEYQTCLVFRIPLYMVRGVVKLLSSFEARTFELFLIQTSLRSYLDWLILLYWTLYKQNGPSPLPLPLRLQEVSRWYWKRAKYSRGVPRRPPELSPPQPLVAPPPRTNPAPQPSRPLLLKKITYISPLENRLHI